MEPSKGGGDPIILIPVPCFPLSVSSLPLAADADFHSMAPIKTSHLTANLRVHREDRRSF